MRRADKQPSHGEKTRYLNIVYFVESARSHTIRINLTYARWTLGLLAIIAVWSISSIFWIGHLKYQSSKTHDRLEQALTTIFDYQIKTEKIFDEAYPAEDTSGYYAELAQLPSNNPVADEKPSTTNQNKSSSQPQGKPINKQASARSLTSNEAPKQAQNTTEKPTIALKSPDLEATTSTKIAVAAQQASNETETPTKPDLEISGAKLSKSNGKIYLNFNMKNKNPDRAEGFIWAVAFLTSENGESKQLAAPNHTRIDNTSGEILAPKSGYRFSILKFKNKEFDFKTPSSTEWKLTKLTVHYTNIDGKYEQKIEIPVEQVAIPSVADTPSADVTL
jgi:hypothetical protein